VKQLDGMSDDQNEAPFVKEALMRRLADDDPSVLLAVISGKAILTLPPKEVAAAVVGLLAHARRQYGQPAVAKVDKKLLRDVIKKVLSRLTCRHLR
jgi:hypothetical protein